MTNKRKVLVTGSNGGIGRAICGTLTEQGFVVIGLDIEQSTENVAYSYTADLADVDQLLTCLTIIEQDHGTQLYGLTNNAGLYEALEFENLSIQDYERIMAVNVRAPLFISQWFTKILMSQNNRGVIINIASISGEHGSKDVVYGVSKGAMINLTKSLSLFGAPKIRVNSISPGIIETKMSAKIPQERIKDYERRILNQKLGKPSDIANAVAYLFDDKSNYINGATLNVNGGFQ